MIVCPFMTKHFSKEINKIVLCSLPALNFMFELTNILVHLYFPLLSYNDLLEFLVIVEVSHYIRFVVGCHHQVSAKICTNELFVASTAVDLH